MVDAIIGKWKSDSSKPEGYDEYRAASIYIFTVLRDTVVREH